MPDSSHGPLADGYGSRHAHEVASDQRNVRRLHCDVGARGNGDSHVRLREGGGVVDAVADHRDYLLVLLQGLDVVGFVSGQHVCDHTVDAERTGDSLCRLPTVSGEHDNFDALALQRGNGFTRALLYGIGDRDHAHCLAVNCHVRHRLAGARHLVACLIESVHGKIALLGEP